MFRVLCCSVLVLLALPARADGPAPAPRMVDTGKALRVSGIVTADLGVATVALGAIFAGLSYQAGQEAWHPSSNVYDRAADERQVAYRNADIACFVVGGVAMVVGTTIWMIGRKRRETPARAALVPLGVRF